MKRTRKYQTALVAAVMAGFAFLPQAYAADTEYETDTVKVEAEGVDKYLVTTNTITEQEIAERGYRDLADILSQVPGLYMAPAAKDSKMVRVRGASSDQTKIYIDGIPAFPLTGIVSNAASDLSTIPADSIAKVEIIKGSGPVQYGTDYKGGVILITTKDGKGSGKFRVSVAGGSNHTYDAKLGYSGSDKNVSYAVNLSKHYSAGYLENQMDKKLYFDGKIRFKTSSKSSLMLNGYYSDMEREIPESIDPATGQYLAPSGPRWSVAPGDGVTPSQARNNNATDWRFKGFRQSNIALQYESRPNDIWQYNVKYYHIIDENNLWVRNLLNTEGGSLPRFTHRAPQWYRSGWFSRGNGVEANATVAYDSKNVLSFGAKYIKLSWNTDENNTSYRRYGNDARRSFYVENAWSADSRTRLTIGIRREDVTQDFRDNDSASQKTTSKSNAFDPVLNFTHDVTKRDTIRLSAGRSHVFVGSKDAAGNIRNGYPVPKPERNNNYEIGWKHKFGSKAEFDLTHFRTEVRDRLTFVKFGRDRVLGNVDKTHIRGLELAYRQTFSPKLSAFANYTWINAKDEENGVTKLASGLPTQMFNLGVTYREGKLRSTLLGRAMRARLDSSGDPDSSGYFTADLDLRYEPQTDLGIFLRVNNLFDTDYQYRWGSPADGTNFLLGADMTF